MIQIYNSLVRGKEPLAPLVPGEVRMYVCGMTVYDYCHLGHARVMVVFDVVVRYLRSRGLAVTYVRNITDIDDKIIKRAAESGESIEALTGRFIDAMHADADALGVLRPDSEPRATASMDEITTMIATLLDKGYAYRANNGDVYYRVSRFPDYGRLSGKRIEDLRAGERVEVSEAKEDPLDFVLWKAAKPGEPQWPSPWGGGRPGWHIECSAMSTHCLGAHFDIHGGGMDLMFPHHENEIAQSEAATGHKFVNVWMHNGFVQIDEEKMSKSLGNFFTVREILARYKAEVVRYFILASHYRSPLNYSDRNLDTARAGLDRYYQALRGLTPAAAASGGDYQARFEAAMDDDFNTPEAWAVLSDLRNHVNLAKDKGELDEANRLAAVLVRLGGVLGMLQQAPEDWFKTGVVARPESHGSHSSALNSNVATADGKPTLDDIAIQSLIDQRATARRNKDFATSDLIREELDAQGILLEDGPQGTTWRRKS